MLINPKNTIFTINEISSKEVYFPDYVKAYFSTYIDYLKSIKYATQIVSKIEGFAYNLNICLKDYYCGQHDSAQFFFRKAIGCIDCNDVYRNLTDCLFYRARKNENSLFSPSEMFHIRFEHRYKVRTQRYSYPGLPCLYLGSSIEVCCDELGCWDDNLNIAQVSKQSSEDIGIFDLYFFEEYDFNNLEPEQENQFVCLWPLVACCSFTYQNADGMSFRPDYIVPQLLLEYIIDKNAENGLHGSDTMAYGIRYHSVKKPLINFNSSKSTCDYINYVFPVLSNGSTGFCEMLERIFRVEQVFLLGKNNK